MSQSEDRWADLIPRVLSAVVMVAIAAAGLMAGGFVFLVLIAVVAGIMVWELIRMLAPHAATVALVAGVGAGVLVLAGAILPLQYFVPLAVVSAIACAVLVEDHKPICAAFVVFLLLAAYEFLQIRNVAGLAWMLWLVAIVVAADVSGYFAGKSIGGPKFWPSVSPKKTWSGTIAGWAAGAVIGLIFLPILKASVLLLPFSVLMAFAGQLGDIAESAIKRMVGVKDSSALIPGHGGLLDRFDGMLGAALFALVAGGLVGLP